MTANIANSYRSAKAHGDKIAAYKVDIDAYPHAAKFFQITETPTVSACRSICLENMQLMQELDRSVQGW